MQLNEMGLCLCGGMNVSEWKLLQKICKFADLMKLNSNPAWNEEA